MMESWLAAGITHVVRADGLVGVMADRSADGLGRQRVPCRSQCRRERFPHPRRQHGLVVSLAHKKGLEKITVTELQRTMVKGRRPLRRGSPTAHHAQPHALQGRSSCVITLSTRSRRGAAGNNERHKGLQDGEGARRFVEVDLLPRELWEDDDGEPAGEVPPEVGLDGEHVLWTNRASTERAQFSHAASAATCESLEAGGDLGKANTHHTTVQPEHTWGVKGAGS